MILGHLPLATTPLASADLPSLSFAPVGYRLASRTYISGPNDNPRYTMFQGRVMGALSMERTIPIIPDKSQRALLQLGDMSLMNGDGYLDSMVQTRAIDGRRIKVEMVRRGDTLANAQTVFDGTAAGWTLADPTTLRVALRDAAWELITPLQESLYSGAGRANGTDDLAGKPKPKCYGECHNIRPVLLDPELGVRQINDGPIEEVMAAYDAGVPLTLAGFSGDIFNAPPPPPGGYLVDLNGGYIRTSTQPLGEITADVRGDRSQHGYVATVSDIAYRLIRVQGRMASTRVSPRHFQELLNKQSAVVGFYTYVEPVTIADALDVLFGSIGAWWGPNAKGAIECGRFDLPADHPYARLDQRRIMSFETGEPPEAVSPAVWRVVVGFKRNWTVMDPSAIAGIVKETQPDRFSFLTQDLRDAVYQDETVRLRHLLAKELRVPSLMVHQSDAEAEAERIGRIWGSNRFISRIDLKTQGMLLGLDRTIGITFPRYGMERGVNAVVIGTGLDTETNSSFVEVFH